MSMRSPIQFKLPIQSWCVWHAGDPLDISFVDAGLRRRLSPLAKMFLHAAHTAAKSAADTNQPTRVVYASQHGDLAHTSSMLLDLAKQEPLSPTSFNMAVHNANPGIWSILRQDTSTNTAICADEATLGWGMLEASMQWQTDKRTPVLFVYADEPVPALFDSSNHAAEPAMALALLIVGEEDGGGGKVKLDMTVAPSGHPLAEYATSFPHVLAQQLRTGGQWQGVSHLWSWQCTV